MARRMTVVFDDEALYTALKVEAARRGCYAKDIVASAVREWLETQEDEALQPAVEQARREWRRCGGVEAGAFFRDLEAGQGLGPLPSPPPEQAPGEGTRCLPSEQGHQGETTDRLEAPCRPVGRRVGSGRRTVL